MIKPKKIKSEYVKICPRCGSLNIKISQQGQFSGFTALGTPTIYVCLDCKYKNNIFPEIDLNEKQKDEQEHKNNLDKKQKNEEN